jgi:hypothetical protein
MTCRLKRAFIDESGKAGLLLYLHDVELPGPRLHYPPVGCEAAQRGERVPMWEDLLHPVTAAKLI